MRKQRGVSLLGLLVIGFMVGFVMLLGFKLVPAYVEYFAVKKTLAVLAKEQKTSPPEEIRKAFGKRAVIEDINSFRAEDLDIAQDKNGLTIAVAYEKIVPVLSNIYILIKFEVSSDGNATSGSSEESK